ncbi:hypothetical protein V8E55_003433 [Tylopilus felleus]
MLFKLFALVSTLRIVHGHACIWHPSMFGFNVTQQTFSYDNRPLVPLQAMTFNQWWFHGHLDYPPHPEDIFELPAGQNVTTQVACNKGATTYYASSDGGNIQVEDQPNDVCPGAPPSEYHTTGISDVKGCALGIAYQNDISQVQPADFVIFSVNQTCVWNRYTDFSVPEKMPPCPGGKCYCAFFWIHSPDSGSEQMYMNGFQCNTVNTTSTVGLATPNLARRCGADPANGKSHAVPGNCTYGAKQPLYWYQAEGNNMFEGTYSPPFYNDLYNFLDGAQNDIFQDSYASIPVPGPNQTALPVLAAAGAAATHVPSDGTSTTPTPAPTIPANVTSTSAPTGATGSNGKCPSKRDSPSKRDTSAFSRRHVPAERRSPFTHKVAGMTRRSRTLDPEKRLDIWNPL